MILTKCNNQINRRSVTMLEWTLMIFLLIASIPKLNGEQVDQECPVDCDCHYFRINWVTDCSESNLTSIPYEELSPNVYILDMNGNNIEHFGPFPRDIKLRRLQMAHNRLTHLTYDSFAGLTYLLDADFSSNHITRVDPEAFRDSPGLITLELQNNPLAEITAHFLNCRTLLYLDLSTCGIHQLNTQFFHNTTNLNKLDLSGNPLQEISPGPFDHLTNLEYLKLNNCNLTYISPEAFTHLENLRELDMSDNNLRTVTWSSILAPLVRLEHLDIGNTKIRNLPADAFSRNLYLRHLVLSHNELHHLDIENTLGHNLHNLQTLDLSNCGLQDRLSEQTFQNSSKLRVLNLSGNPMFAGDLTAVLRNLPKLHKLSLSNCSLQRLPDAFDVLEHLEELDISHNPLSDAFVKLLNPLRSLEFLDMSYCSLGYVGNNTYAYMTELKKLILSGNNLHTLEQDLFANLTKLESLELNNCGLTMPLDPKIFGARVYSSVIELKLSGNPLTIPDDGPLLPKQLSNVEILDLSHCNIMRLNENVLSRNRNLTQLNLSNNQIKNLGFLKKLRRLESLDLSNNQLTTINANMVKSNGHLISLNLIGNPFVCNCSIVELWDWAVQERSNLHILVGSQPSEFATGAVKLRKTLGCSYDDETFKNLMNQRPFLRKGDLTPYRTWAKYIRESNCERKS